MTHSESSTPAMRTPGWETQRMPLRLVVAYGMNRQAAVRGLPTENLQAELEYREALLTDVLHQQDVSRFEGAWVTPHIREEMRLRDELPGRSQRFRTLLPLLGEELYDYLGRHPNANLPAISDIVTYGGVRTWRIGRMSDSALVAAAERMADTSGWSSDIRHALAARLQERPDWPLVLAYARMVRLWGSHDMYVNERRFQERIREWLSGVRLQDLSVERLRALEEVALDALKHRVDEGIRQRDRAGLASLRAKLYLETAASQSTLAHHLRTNAGTNVQMAARRRGLVRHQLAAQARRPWNVT